MNGLFEDNISVVKNAEDACRVLNYCLVKWNTEVDSDFDNKEPMNTKVDSDSDNMEPMNVVTYNNASIILARLIGYKVLQDGTLIKINGIGDRTVLTELYYVDREYRDSYYLYYSRKHLNYERFVLRVFIFDTDVSDYLQQYDYSSLNRRLIGSCVVRPLAVGAIGRTLVAPQYIFESDEQLHDKQFYVRTTKYTVSPYGMPLQIEAFPFMMQDDDTITCAEVTILNILDYFSREYDEYKFLLPSGINNIVTKYGFERMLPSHGLQYELVTRVFTLQGFQPRLYMAKQQVPTWDIKRCIHRYVESGLPVAMEISPGDDEALHSIVCVGYCLPEYTSIGSATHRLHSNLSEKYRLHFLDTADACSQYVIMDDNDIPYKVESVVREKKGQKVLPGVKKDCYKIGGREIIGFSVPLHARMIMDAPAAEAICLAFLSGEKTNIEKACCSLANCDEEYKTAGSAENPLVIRLLLASAGTYRAERVKASHVKEFKDQYATIPLPHFVWVCELYTLESLKEKKIIGEIVLDGTASPHVKYDSILLLHYPKRFAVRYPSDNIEDLFKMFECSCENWQPIKEFSGNLFLNGKRNSTRY